MKKLLCLVLLALALPQSADACTIPVFRYALEKWDLTPYEVTVYHRGPLPEDVAKELKKWTDAPNKANLEITHVDLDAKMTKAQKQAWDKDGDAKQLPWMIVRYAAADPSEPSAFRGPCTVANLNSIVDSPMRRAILAHLTRGASTVFVLMTSDDEKADRAAIDMSLHELQLLERKIKIPVQSDDGPKIKLPIPLKVSFPVLVLDRNQPEEAAFVRMLLATEERLFDMKGPILFPIFGRGRVLGGLTGKEISPDQLMEVAKFLCRECSCQVKELNPGIDLLMSVHWNDAFDQMYDGKEPIPLPAFSPAYLGRPTPKTDAAPKMSSRTENWKPAPVDEIVAARVAAPSPSPSVEVTDEQRMSLRIALWIGIGIASGLVLLTGSWVVVQVRS
jgi:hypothetical protein